ncbi:MAG: hypothetical protein WA317_06265 [Mycobacterium sp.]|uniref:hypothetical protein n=1 Tax=Mycobacterium sp. TaxID=1785 RepID=UPI003CC51A3A
MAQLWQDDPDEYDRQVRLRNQRWAQRDAQRYEQHDEFDDVARQESCGLDPIDEEDVLP